MCDGMDGVEAAIFECVPPQDLVFGSMVEQVSATPSPMPSSNGDRRFLCCRLPQSVNEATKLYQQAIQAAVPAFERTVRRFSLLASAEQPRLSELPLQAFGLGWASKTASGIGVTSRSVFNFCPNCRE